MRDAIAHIHLFIDDFDFSQFRDDIRTRYAVCYALLIIPEASRRLPANLKQRNPQIPWLSVADLGNVYRHEYHNVNELFVWETVQEGLPPLQEVIDQELARFLSE